jgi:hypothetical protein
MSKFDDVYGGRWLKASDLDGVAKQFQIEAAEWQKVGKEQEEKLVLAFIGKQKGLILNPTNAKALAEEWGKDERLWPGRWLEARAVETAFGPGVRVKPTEAPLEEASSAIPF